MRARPLCCRPPTCTVAIDGAEDEHVVAVVRAQHIGFLLRVATAHTKAPPGARSQGGIGSDAMRRACAVAGLRISVPNVEARLDVRLELGRRLVLYGQVARASAARLTRRGRQGTSTAVQCTDLGKAGRGRASRCQGGQLGTLSACHIQGRCKLEELG